MTALPAHEPRVAETHVNVTINGRQYRLACEEGEETHLRQLAKDVDDRITGLRVRFGEIGNARLIVMVALMVADELSEAANRLQRLEEELDALQGARVSAANRDRENQAAIAAAFNAAAERIEGLVKKLNQSLGGPVLATEPS